MCCFLMKAVCEDFARIFRKHNDVIKRQALRIFVYAPIFLVAASTAFLCAFLFALKYDRRSTLFYAYPPSSGMIDVRPLTLLMVWNKSWKVSELMRATARFCPCFPAFQGQQPATEFMNVSLKFPSLSLIQSNVSWATFVLATFLFNCHRWLKPPRNVCPFLLGKLVHRGRVRRFNYRMIAWIPPELFSVLPKWSSDFARFTVFYSWIWSSLRNRCIPTVLLYLHKSQSQRPLVLWNARLLRTSRTESTALRCTWGLTSIFAIVYNLRHCFSAGFLLIEHGLVSNSH